MKIKLKFLILVLTVFVGAGIFGFTNLVFGVGKNIDVGMEVPSQIPSCGDGVVAGLEVCDPGTPPSISANLNGKNCSSQGIGFTCGNLKCKSDCSDYDISSCSNNCGDGCTDASGPSIDIISTSATESTAKLVWSAFDLNNLASRSFTYGVGNYNNTGSINNLGNNQYEVNLNGLSLQTTYSYKISATDASCGNNTTEKTGTFSTSAPADTVAPIISDVQIIPGITTSSISWKTNEGANTEIKYGLQTSYGAKYLSSDFSTTHNVLLGSATVCLNPNTTYHLKIFATDFAGNVASTDDYSFTTKKDDFSPLPVTDFLISKLGNAFDISWVNPVNPVMPSCPDDFAGVAVVRKVNSYSTNILDGTEVYRNVGTNFSDSNISLDTVYFYTAFAFDTSGNYSTGVFASSSIKKIIGTEQICNNGIDDDSDGKTDCADPDCSGQVGCTQCSDGIDNDGDGKIDMLDPGCSSPTDNDERNEICNNGIDDDANGLTDCADSFCAGKIGCTQCSDGIDNDGDGKIDLADPGCNNDPLDNDEYNTEQVDICGNGIKEGNEGCDNGPSNGACPATCSLLCVVNSNCPPAIGGNNACSDGVDNDNDGLIDMADPGCLNPEDDDEYNPPIITPTSTALNLSNFIFRSGKRNLDLNFFDGELNGLPGAPLSVLLNKSYFLPSFEGLILRAYGGQYIFSLDENNNYYFADLVFPQSGEEQIYIEYYFKTSNGERQLVSIPFLIKTLPYGKVQKSGGGELSGVSVKLYNSDGTLFSANSYGANNPMITNGMGNFGWMVPNGNYYLDFFEKGFYERKTQIFSVRNNVVNGNYDLIEMPPNILDIIDPEAPLPDNIKKIAENLGLRTKNTAVRTVQIVNEAVNNPDVEKAVENVVAPATAGAVAAATLPSIWFSLLDLLRFIFLQPFMLIGRRKRERWGLVYNSLDKLPIDLATVRLLDATTRKVIQSRVTDRNGRFFFSAPKGSYILQVNKHGFSFPSAILKPFKDDGRRTDIYHGEVINVIEDSIWITPNIPLDPPEVPVKTIIKLRLEKLGRILQLVLGWAGVIISGISLYITPTWYMWILFGFQLILFVVFRYLFKPGKPKGWGIVYDKENKLPLNRVIIRLFDAKFNRLISTQVTDKKGRYAFLAGDNKYYLTFEHKDYVRKTSGEIDLMSKPESIIAVDTNLEKEKKA